MQLHSNSEHQLIGCFSAASNITGILTDTNKVSACLHRYGALALWDYATAGTIHKTQSVSVVGVGICPKYRHPELLVQ